jgi:hypothetical protein
MWLGKHAIDQPCILELVQLGDAEVVQCINLFRIIALASLAKCFEYLILPRPALCRNLTVCQWSTSCDISLIYRHEPSIQPSHHTTLYALRLQDACSSKSLEAWYNSVMFS